MWLLPTGAHSHNAPPAHLAQTHKFAPTPSDWRSRAHELALAHRNNTHSQLGGRGFVQYARGWPCRGMYTYIWYTYVYILSLPLSLYILYRTFCSRASEFLAFIARIAQIFSTKILPARSLTFPAHTFLRFQESYFPDHFVYKHITATDTTNQVRRRIPDTKIG